LARLASVARPGDDARILEILPHQLSSEAPAGAVAAALLQPVAQLPLLGHAAALVASADNPTSSPESSSSSSDQDRKPRAKSPSNV
jgi:hypothetical protein